jgi:hypothetical protein
MSKRPNKIGVDVSARMFYAALSFVSTEETRYYLNGVAIEPHPEKGALLVATDGHRMIVLHDEAGYAGRKVILPADKALVDALKRATKDGDIRLLIDKEGVVSLPRADYRAEKNRLIDGTFPDWPRVAAPVRRALAAGKRANPAFNPALIASFMKVCERLGMKDHNPAIRIVAPAANEAALVLFKDVPHAFGLLMPMRAFVGNLLPVFMRPILQRVRAPKKQRRAA